MGQSNESNTDGENSKKTRVPSEVEKEILRALQNLTFGSIEIVVHDSKVVQIERKEKVRFS